MSNLLLLLLLPLAPLPPGDSVVAQIPTERLVQILEVAESWRAGDPVPPELRRFYELGSDIPAPGDTASLFSRVNNVELLATIAVDLGADEECREIAIGQGRESVGPTRFFGVVRPYLDADQDSKEPWMAELRSRMSRRHVVVDALFIDYTDMPKAKANTLLEGIKKDLTRGEPWNEVYTRYSSRVGNLGHFIVFADPALGRGYYATLEDGAINWKGESPPRRLWGLRFFDASHLTLRIYEQHVLYQVQEVYEGTSAMPADRARKN